jgi:hypothetical protein
MTTGLEEQFDKSEFIISILQELKDKVDLNQKSNALLLAEIAELRSEIELIKDIVSRRFRTQNDSQVARRERTWS